MTLTLNNQTKPEASRRKEILKMRTEISKTSFDVPKPEIKINLVLWGYLLKSVPLGNYSGYHFQVGEMKAEVWTTSQLPRGGEAQKQGDECSCWLLTPWRQGSPYVAEEGWWTGEFGITMHSLELLVKCQNWYNPMHKSPSCSLISWYDSNNKKTTLDTVVTFNNLSLLEYLRK